MTAPTPVGFLDFFILEAGDYVEQLDGLLLSASERGPDADAMQRVARALRGSSTMAKLGSFSELAGGLERVGRALREGGISWSPALRGAIVSTVDDLKILLRNVRAWGEADEARARERIGELAGYAAVRPSTPAGAPTTQGHDSYLATEAANIGAGLELLATRPTDRDAATNVLRRVRALRGIASVKDHDALADVLEAAEQAMQPLERGEGPLGPERIALLGSSANVLRGVASAIRSGTQANTQQAEVARFSAALEAVQERETGAERVVPIADLFFADGGATVVEASATPPTTPAERFRLESVSQGEHLRRLVGDARGARDELARERVKRGLRHALRSLQQSAESFGEKSVADFVAAHSDAALRLDARTLDDLDAMADQLAHPGPGGVATPTRASVASPAPASTPSVLPQTPVFSTPRVPDRIEEVLTAPMSMTPVRPSVSVPAPSMTPQERVAPAVAQIVDVASQVVSQVASGAARLGDLLDTGIRSLGALHATPLSAPISLSEQPAVSIGVLVYRGRAAIERAREIRDAAKRGGRPVEGEALDELYDLLDLALTN
ncbi:MAG: Hpt domain-containing protein [Gemmatimonadaceae bacterium]